MPLKKKKVFYITGPLHILVKHPWCRCYIKCSTYQLVHTKLVVISCPYKIMGLNTYFVWILRHWNCSDNTLKYKCLISVHSCTHHHSWWWDIFNDYWWTSIYQFRHNVIMFKNLNNTAVLYSIYLFWLHTYYHVRVMLYWEWFIIQIRSE